MANGDKKVSSRVSSGEVTGTGATISVYCGFKPKAVTLINKTGECLLFWNDSFPDASGYKISGIVGGSNASSTVPGVGLDLTTPVFSGTGQTSAGQVITTTDNQTMTLNQCAGMLFISATHGPYVIASNTAVTGAPAVLTILGDTPTTDAGAYKIVKTAAGTAAAQVFTATASDTAYISSLGVTPLYNGFQIGADTDLNVTAETIYWTAIK